MGFWTVFKKTGSDFKKNAGNILKANFWFVLFPYMIILLFLLASIIFSGTADDLKSLVEMSVNSALNNQTSMTTQLENQMMEYVVNIIWKLFVIIGISLILATIAFFTGIFGYLCTLSVKEKESFKDLKKRVKPNYWRFVGLITLLMLICTGIMIALLIVFIPIMTLINLIPFSNIFTFILEILLYLLMLLFFIRFVFSPFIFIYENKKVGECIRLSWDMSKKNWFKLFGYSVLLGLIYMAIGIIFYILGAIVVILFMLPHLASISSIEGNLSITQILSVVVPFITWISIIYLVYMVFTYLILVPFAMLFFKNIYLELKNKKSNFFN